MDDIREGALFSLNKTSASGVWLLPYANEVSLMIADPTAGRGRLELDVRIHKRLRELLLLFSRHVSGNSSGNAGVGAAYSCPRERMETGPGSDNCGSGASMAGARLCNCRNLIFSARAAL